MKTWMIGLTMLAFVIAAPAHAAAKGGGSHKVSGTISSIQGNNVQIKEANGTTVTVMLDSKTQFTRGKAASERSALKVGEHVVAHGTGEKGKIVATTVKISKSSPPKTSKK